MPQNKNWIGLKLLSMLLFHDNTSTKTRFFLNARRKHLLTLLYAAQRKKLSEGTVHQERGKLKNLLFQKKKED